MRGVFGDGVNDPRMSALKRAYVVHGGRDLEACTKLVRAAVNRIDSSVTTFEMEMKRMERRGLRLW